MHYNEAGQLEQVVTEGSVIGINITYDNHGHLTSWTRGNMGVAFDYEEPSGHLVEKRFPNRATYRYIYKSDSNKVSLTVFLSMHR